ncbi:MAG: type II toxin-antitoxin system VapC family toxin, partial [Thermodesulfovibrionales bacterium]
DQKEDDAEDIGATFRKHRVVSSVLLYPEVISALNRKRREGGFTESGFNQALSAFKRDYDFLYKVQLSQNVLELTERLLYKYPLRALDSIHLSSALLFMDIISNNILFLSADRRLLNAAMAEGLVCNG